MKRKKKMTLETNIDMCPHMPARCPHHSEWCEYEESRECHHVISFKNTLALLATRTLEFDLEELPRELGEHVKEMETLLDKMSKLV